MTHRLRRTLLGLFAALVAAPLWANQEHVVVGVLSFRPESLALTQWRPLTEYLNQTVPDARFELKIYDYDHMQEAVRQQAVDLVITQPGEYVRMVHQNGLSTPLATLISLENKQPVRAMGGVILARSDRTDLRALKDLQGRRIAIASRLSFGAYQIQVTELTRRGIQHGELIETGLPQDRVIDVLLSGKADAAFVRTGLLESLEREGRLKPGELKVLGQQNYPGYPYALSSRLYPEWPVVAMSHLPEDLAVRIAGALLSLPHGSAAAQRMGIYGFTVPADYEPVRAMMRELRAPPFDQPRPSPGTTSGTSTASRSPVGADPAADDADVATRGLAAPAHRLVQQCHGRGHVRAGPARPRHLHQSHRLPPAGLPARGAAGSAPAGPDRRARAVTHQATRTPCSTRSAGSCPTRVKTSLSVPAARPFRSKSAAARCAARTASCAA